MILHPPTPTPFPYTTLFRSSLSLVGVEPRDHATVLAPHPGKVRDEHEEPRPEASRDRAGRRIAVHVEDLAGDAVERGRRDDRHATGVHELFDERAVDERHTAYKTELGILALGAQHPAVD